MSAPSWPGLHRMIEPDVVVFVGVLVAYISCSRHPSEALRFPRLIFSVFAMSALGSARPPSAPFS